MSILRNTLYIAHGHRWAIPINRGSPYLSTIVIFSYIQLQDKRKPGNIWGNIHTLSAQQLCIVKKSAIPSTGPTPPQDLVRCYVINLGSTGVYFAWKSTSQINKSIPLPHRVVFIMAVFSTLMEIPSTMCQAVPRKRLARESLYNTTTLNSQELSPLYLKKEKRKNTYLNQQKSNA